MEIKLDLSSFEQFLKIVETIEKSQEPSEEEWNSLFETPGYKALIESEFNKEFFKRSFLAVFDPKRNEELNVLLEGKTARYIKYYQQVKQVKDRYDLDINDIKKNWTELQDKIFARAAAFLPYRIPEKNPTVSILVFDTDARGYDTLIIDASFTFRIEDFVSLTAHEVHHFYRNQMLQYDKEKIEEEDKELIWILNQIQGEGIADHIDKDYFIFGNIKTAFPEAYVKFYKDRVEKVPLVIKDINKISKEYSENKISISDLGKKLKDLVSLAGHPLGYFITNIIIKNSYFDDLIRILGNPFKFFELYNKAARIDRENVPLFSENFIMLTSSLEKKYCK